MTTPQSLVHLIGVKTTVPSQVAHVYPGHGPREAWKQPSLNQEVRCPLFCSGLHFPLCYTNVEVKKAGKIVVLGVSTMKKKTGTAATVLNRYRDAEPQRTKTNVA